MSNENRYTVIAPLLGESNLPVNINLREAIATILSQHLQLSAQQLASVFPNYQPVNDLSLLR